MHKHGDDYWQTALLCRRGRPTAPTTANSGERAVSIGQNAVDGCVCVHRTLECDKAFVVVVEPNIWRRPPMHSRRPSASSKGFALQCARKERERKLDNGSICCREF